MQFNNKKCLLILAIALGGYGAGGGCDESQHNDSTLGISEGAGAISEDVSLSAEQGDSPTPQSETTSGLTNDGPVLPISMRWIDFERGKAVESDFLAMDVENRTKFDYEITAELSCSGMMSFKRVVPFGRRGIQAGQRTVFSVPAERVPIQVTDGAAQAIVRFTLTRLKNGEPINSVRYYSTAINYRHEADYKHLKIFDEATLIRDYGGKFTSMAPGLDKKQETVGRVIEDNGELREVKASDEAFVVRHDGEVWFERLGVRLSVGTLDGPSEVVP